MAGVKGRSGPRKSPTSQLREGLEQLQGDIPGILEKLKDLAFGKPIVCQHCGGETGQKGIDREAAIYLVDRIMGKPKQVQEVDLLARTELTSSQALKMYHQLEEYRAQYMALNPAPLLLKLQSAQNPSSRPSLDIVDSSSTPQDVGLVPNENPM